METYDRSYLEIILGTTQVLKRYFHYIYKAANPWGFWAGMAQEKTTSIRIIMGVFFGG